MNLSIIGPRGAGKTTVSRLLAKRMDKKLISTDLEIENRIKTSIQKFVKKYGIDGFREVESGIIEKISDFDECVFDTADSVIMRNENIINLKKNGSIILLTADIKTIAERIKNSREIPPKAKKVYTDEIKNIFPERENRYKKAADYTIDTSRLSPEEICDLITYYARMEIR